MNKSGLTIKLLTLLVVASNSSIPSFADKQITLTEDQKRQLDQQSQELKRELEHMKQVRKSLENLQTGLGGLHTAVNGLSTGISKATTDSAALARQQLPEMEKRLGRSNPQVLSLYTIIALDYLEKKEYPQAEHMFTWLLQAREKVSGSNSKETADVLVNLAHAKFGQNNYNGAIPLYERGVKILENVHGFSPACDLLHKDRAYMGLIESYDKLGKKAEADKWREIKKAAYRKAGYGK